MLSLTLKKWLYLAFLLAVSLLSNSLYCFAADITPPLVITYPKDGDVLPAAAPPPTFKWQALGGQVIWSSSIRIDGVSYPISMVTDEPSWQLSMQDWDVIRKAAVERDAVLVVSAMTGKKTIEARARFRVAAEILTPPPLPLSVVPVPQLQLIPEEKKPAGDQGSCQQSNACKDEE